MAAVITRRGFQTKNCTAHATETIAQADALIFGRVMYGLMEAFRGADQPATRPDWLADWMMPFARTINGAKKYVVSRTMADPGWNTEVVRGDFADVIRRLKDEPGRGLYVGGITLPRALAELGLIDEYEFIVQPRLAGHGPKVFDGLSRYVDLRLVGRTEFASGSVAMRYEPVR